MVLLEHIYIKNSPSGGVLHYGAARTYNKHAERSVRIVRRKADSQSTVKSSSLCSHGQTQFDMADTVRNPHGDHRGMATFRTRNGSFDNTKSLTFVPLMRHILHIVGPNLRIIL